MEKKKTAIRFASSPLWPGWLPAPPDAFHHLLGQAVPSCSYLGTADPQGESLDHGVSHKSSTWDSSFHVFFFIIYIYIYVHIYIYTYIPYRTIPYRTVPYHTIPVPYQYHTSTIPVPYQYHTKPYHYITLHYTTLHYTTLHYTSLHYIAYIPKYIYIHICVNI